MFYYEGDTTSKYNSRELIYNEMLEIVSMIDTGDLTLFWMLHDILQHRHMQWHPPW